jgi:cytoplasmic tRNA 2-thiolation protein 1
MAETLSLASFLVVMRGDIARLGRCTLICTQGEDTIKRSKPFKYAYEKEIVM